MSTDGIENLEATAKPIGEVIRRMISRREALMGIASATAGAMMGHVAELGAGETQTASGASPIPLGFKEIEHVRRDNPAQAAQVVTVNVPEGYTVEVVAKWGITGTFTGNYGDVYGVDNSLLAIYPQAVR